MNDFKYKLLESSNLNIQYYCESLLNKTKKESFIICDFLKQINKDLEILRRNTFFDLKSDYVINWPMSFLTKLLEKLLLLKYKFNVKEDLALDIDLLCKYILCLQRRGI